jgi:hypothetical protein
LCKQFSALESKKLKKNGGGGMKLSSRARTLSGMPTSMSAVQRAQEV